MTLDNAAIAELLAREGEKSEGTLRRAFKRAARAAFLWPVEAGALLESGRSLTELPSIGPYLERQLKTWMGHPPAEIEPAPIRRHFLTLSRAKMLLNQRPDWVSKYRGDLQMHSRWSDGAATIGQMAEAARQRGYDYIAITDHSQGLKIAGGISPEELFEQAQEILRANARFKDFRILRALELNLNPQGQGDMPHEALEELDLVVGSFHSQLRQTTDQTERYLAALANPEVTILGHPVGRIYNHRLGLTADWPRICAHAARLDKALEVDSYPDRQDLNIELLQIVRQEGARVAIDTDAHAPEQLAFAELGLAAALQAGISQNRIVNFMATNELLTWAGSLKAATPSSRARKEAARAPRGIKPTRTAARRSSFKVNR